MQELERLRSLAEGTDSPPHRDRFDIHTDRLFGAITGFELPMMHASLGHGLHLRQTYTRLIVPMLLAFDKPARPGAPHPGPWAALGEQGQDLTVELELEPDAPSLGFDRPNTHWFVVALLRLKLALPLRMPVLADRPIRDIATAVETGNVVPVELHLERLLPAPTRTPAVSDIEWVAENLDHAARLMKEPIFNRAFQALDRAIHTQAAEAGVVIAWASIETLIRPGSNRITERVCRALAAFLHEPGPERDRAFNQISASYLARGGAAHAGQALPSEEYQTAFGLARAALLQSVENRELPEIESLLAKWKAKS